MSTKIGLSMGIVGIVGSTIGLPLLLLLLFAGCRHKIPCADGMPITWILDPKKKDAQWQTAQSGAVQKSQWH